MKFGGKRRLQKEQERTEKQQAQKKKNKKQITILVSVFAVLCVIIGIGALTENNPNNLPDSSAIVSSTSEVSTSEPSISATTPTEQGETAPLETTQAPSGQTQPPAGTTISSEDIPAYSGSGAYIAINNNVPYFTDTDYTTTAFENYSALDSLGRCGVAYANVCQEIMPTEERGSIGQVKPSGWHTVKYDCVDGKYLYNRCHLIGYQLSAENANTKNLITGTRYLNVDGMLPFENMVADYVKETNNHVLYRVTPVFDGNNLVATGVLMEALSVEDKGDGISFNVFCYNIQPGIIIDYATGDSELESDAVSESQAPVVTQEPEQTPSTQSSGQTYILNTNTHKFHYPSCSSVGQMSDANKQEYTGSRDDLIAQGYEPCKRCNP
ncbi:MAG: DNA/RNA non-specific endonuclease [Clostridiales bacterium]|jgi:DNA-entry nuclease|nr:DNA/RNA non-specific endonuclease [Clostridiales bacterium]